MSVEDVGHWLYAASFAGIFAYVLLMFWERWCTRKERCLERRLREAETRALMRRLGRLCACQEPDQ